LFEAAIRELVALYTAKCTDNGDTPEAIAESIHGMTLLCG